MKDTSLPPDDSSPQKTDRAIFDRISFSWIAFLCGAFLLAVSGAFTAGAVEILSGCTVLGALWFLRRLRPSRELSVVGIALILLVLLPSYFSSSPSVFSGRDQGSYAEAAIRLAHEHSLVSHTPSASRDFFRLYGEGKALNVPGFFYTAEGALTTQFPLGAITWFGAGVSLFGIAGLSLANAFTFFFSLLTIFFFLRRFLPLSFAAGGVAVATLSFPFVWISDSTLSENLALPLFLLVSFSLASFLKNPRAFSWWLATLSASMLFLTRIEGFSVFVVAFFLVVVRRESRSYLKAHLFSTTLPALVVSGIFFGISVFSNLPFYRTVGKAVIEPILSFGKTPSPGIHGISMFSSLFRNMEIFWTYGMISVFALAVLGTIFLFLRRRYLRLTPFFLALPTSAYFLIPNISPDHPWMLRRFTFSLWPTAIILSLFAVAHLHEVFQRRYPGKSLFRPAIFSLLFSSLLVLPAFPATIPILFFSENKDLLEDVETLSRNFSDSRYLPNQSLILVDRMASGDPYSMIADPMSTLFDTNAVYFFNPDDLSRLDLSRFKSVYLIVRDGDEAAYREALGVRFSLEPVHPYTLRTSMLSREIDPSRLPTRKSSVVSGMIFLVVP